MAQTAKFDEFRGLSEPPSGPPPNKHWGMLALSLVGMALVGYLLFWARAPETEVIEAVVVGEEAERVPINHAEVVDASADRGAVAREGYRYKVRIEDESSDGVAGVTHIGGLVTFVPDARPGEMVIVEITRLKERTADAMVIKRLPEETIAWTPPPPRPARPPMFSPDGVYTSVVLELGKKGDAITKINGKVVFLPGAQPGDRVTFRVVEERDSAATGEVLTREPGPVPEPSAEYSGPRPAMTRPPMFTPDAVYTGKVTDIGKKGDALIKVDGKVVFLPGAQLGDEVVFRVVSERDTTAQGEVISRTPAAP